uniref:Liprin-beta-1-like n=1 Tax=Gadus morhua TaxID=8049 RepID=A0A8C5FNP7_GADMO
MMSDASEMLAAALEQMDGIIAGSKAMDYSNGLFDCQSPSSPFLGGMRALHLLEDLRAALELMDGEERDNLRCQIPDSTAEGLAEWLHQGRLAAYQERLSRLESDKECLVLQVSVLTDQVEVQGEKIRDLDRCLAEHREKLNNTEQLFQQELSTRTTLETQRTELMSELSRLKVKLSDLERDRQDAEVNARTSTRTHLHTFRTQTCRSTSWPMDLIFIRWLCVSCLPSAHWLTARPIDIQLSLLLVVGSICKRPESPGGHLGSKLQDGRLEPRGWVDKHGGVGVFGVPRVCVCVCVCGPDVFLFPAEAEQRGTDHLDLAVAPPPPPRGSAPAGPDSASSPETRKKTKGLRKFFGRMKRSHSSSLNLDDPSDSEFRRGGVRATAGPRLGWSHDLKPADPPFPQWSSDQVCGWLAAQGLGQYVAQGREWILSGQTLLDAPQSDLEKELCIRNPLHRKKLQLALRAAVGPEDDDLQGKLNHNWVTRWLDDIGLPQYKSQFDEARVDGRMLHHMTVEDLLSLKVGSVLHHLSIKRAVQVLRLNRYQPNCLRRRPSDENNITPAEVAQWTNHRVMEWLRSVDLAEYAPNLRGSGVHGGLMVLEPRFNVETLALLLNIPPSKTLLRRHLGTHFTLLTGAEAGRSKQDGLENPDYSLLTATARVKPRRLSFGGFGTLRRKQPEDTSDYVCPIDVEMPKNASFQQGLPSYGQLAQVPGLDRTELW